MRRSIKGRDSKQLRIGIGAGNVYCAVLWVNKVLCLNKSGQRVCGGRVEVGVINSL